ncbi:MAG: DNA-processing protein DprA, partial [Tepidimonas sp.]
MAPDDWVEWLRLIATPGVGSAMARRLLAAFGPPAAVLAQPYGAWAEAVGPTVASRLQAEPPDWPALLTRTQAWLAQPDHHLIALGDAAYPSSLLTIPDPPPLLHVVGDPTALSAPRALAVVGSRNPTPQG